MKCCSTSSAAHRPPAYRLKAHRRAYKEACMLKVLIGATVWSQGISSQVLRGDVCCCREK